LAAGSWVQGSPFTRSDKESDPSPGCGPDDGCQVAGSDEPLELNGNKDAELILILKDVKLNLRTLQYHN